MKTIVATLVFLLSANAFAKDSHLICSTGFITDLDIKIESQADGREKLSVILTGMDGETVRTFVNSNFSEQALSKGLVNGKIQAIVSKSDLRDTLGIAFLNAGMLELNFNPQSQKYDVNFAAEGNVFSAACSESKN